MIRSVTGCSDCPFFGEADGWVRCQANPDCPSLEDEPRPLTMPTWCPLRSEHFVVMTNAT